MTRLAILFLGAVLCANAQSALGTLTGTVTDPQGATVPGVEVIATNTATNLRYQGVTTDSGVYVLGNLPAGPYEIAATASGFKQVRRTGLTLEVAQRLRVDFLLEIGNVADRVDVVAELPRVQTEDSSLSTVVERKRIEQLPLNGRHVFNLVKIVGGVTPRSKTTDGFAEINNQTFSQMRINGGPAYGNQFMLDGVSNTAAVHNEISVVPLADAVEEFRVETNSLKAEYGQTAGGVINAVTKSGTNEFHGSLYEFLRNDSLDARNAFATQPDRRTGRIKQVLRYNQYGGTAGGPVLIPKLYNGRDRTFFFAGYEQWKWRSTGSPRIGTVATPLERSGDFSNTRDARGNVLPLFDPATTAANPAGSGFIRQPLPGNIVPRSRMDPLSLRVLEYMPLPNATPTDAFTNTNNLVSLVGSTSDQGVTNLRVDHRFTDKDTVYVRYSGSRNTRNDRGWGLGAADPAARDDQRDNHNGTLNYTKTITATLLNELRGGVTRQWLPFLHPSFDQEWPKKLGHPAIIPQDAFPPAQISGLLTIGNASFSGGLRAQQVTQISDSLTWIRGRHNFKAGMDLRWWRLSFINRLNPSGNFTFTPALTGNPQQPAGTGFGLATYLLGEVSGGSLGIRPFFQFRAVPFATYFQDDWKITRTLTLNLGMRYDLSLGPTEMHNRHTNFDPFARNPETGMAGVLNYAGSSEPAQFVDRDNNNFGPRIGFAWDPRGNGRTAIRAGYGLIYTQLESGNIVPDNTNALGFSVDTPFVAAGGGPFRAFRFSEGPPSIIQPQGPAGGPSAFRGLDVRYQDRNAPSPYLQQWNFTIQQALPGGWIVSGTYAGSKGTKLFGGNYDLNDLHPQYFSLGLALQDQVANPYFGQIRSGALSGQRVSRSQLLRPFPDYTNITTWALTNLASSYHSFQMNLEKRFSRGLSMLVSYTNSKLITECSAIGGGNSGNSCEGEYRLGYINRRLDRAIDQDDVSQRLVVSGVYELPVGRGKALGGGLSRLANGILGGWQVNGIGTFQTGQPLAVRGSNNFTGIPYPDVVRDPTLPSGDRTPVRWFDTDAFRNPADFTIGNAPRTLPTTRGPGLADISFSLFKTFSFLERFRLETRWEMFNAINTVNYNNPNVSFSPNRTGQNINANFGRITSALEPRRMQLGLRLAF
ncbi:MAG: carboxypeptidase regulatory-like domain-containing protein [Bryobacteraceae bacterium]|nr:carboxypeptidase regulatory-like domain-containing protein [Bryobacteraceae bacterium]